MYLLVNTIINNTLTTRKHRAWLSLWPGSLKRWCSCIAAVPLLLLLLLSLRVLWLRGCVFNPDAVWVYIVLPPEQYPINSTSRDYVFVPLS